MKKGTLKETLLGMKQILTSATAFILILFQACRNKEVVQLDITGAWANPDGAVLELNKDSSFVAKALPAEYFTFYTSKKAVEGIRINGSGVWKIEDGNGYKEVKLTFKKRDGQDLYGLYSVYMAGENGVYQNKP